ncbi:MAG: glycoside hydrolase family 3 C-terminal domain-containing protein [Oscillospiraceae bacterium]|nr:glycoside hydrolase family 3 C-terminal domain-containing protein [Oscillospiraceae bacterium]
MTPKELVSEMTLEEKASLVSGKDFWRLKPIPRIGIPKIAVSDGPHGLRKQSDEPGAGDNDSKITVCFPSGAGLAASFNRDLIQELGVTLAKEAMAERVAVLLGPAINIKRSPLCGRNFEYLSEDPYLAGEMAAAYTDGVQANGVGVCLKHFAANNQERRRMSNSSVVDERTLREIYLPAFEKVVKRSGAWSVMCAYNKLNGTYCSENKRLLTDILRDEWGFDGVVISDWGAVCDRVKGICAGLDLEMPSSGEENTNNIISAVTAGDLDEGELDICCERIVNLIKRSVMGYRNAEQPTFSRDADHDKAREFARETQVLLKNNGVLPLKKNANIVFIGEFAEKPRFQGDGSSHINPYTVDNALDAAIEMGIGVRYVRGFSSRNTKYDVHLAVEAIAAARSADVAVVFAGLPDVMETEGLDRVTLDLPENQNALIDKITAVQPNTVVVLQNGSPVTMPWLGKVSAVLESYLGGEGVGAAQAEILFGEVNPSGKLAETFPIALEDTPCYENFPGNLLTVEYREGIYVGYRYYEKAKKHVMFPFGYGLSYTTFEYSNLSSQWQGENLELKFTVKNAGSRAGAEAAQVYVSSPEGKAFHPRKALKGFEKVYLQPGEKKEICVTLDKRAFQFYNVNKSDWDSEKGEYKILIGASSQDIRLRTTVEIDALAGSPVYPKKHFKSYYTADVQRVPNEEFACLLGTPIPKANPKKGEMVTVNDSLEVAAAKTLCGERIAAVIRRAKSMFRPAKNAIFSNPDFYVHAAMESPIHCIARGAPRADRLRLGLVDFLNGKKSGLAQYFAAKLFRNG